VTPQRTYARPIEGADEVSARAEGAELVVEAVKTVRSHEPYLAGHFPGATLYPAVFLLDGIRQIVGAELHRSPVLSAHVGEPQDWLELGHVKSARVLHPMLEGTRLSLHISVSAADLGALHAVLTARRSDGTDVAKMTVELVRGGTS
jgi:3-hydroxymyristoyl/3-hydroxydecanoyl-(acyl carrier protein) dehydratase